MTADSAGAKPLEICGDLDLVICGLQEIDGKLDQHVTHVLSILDPVTPEPEKFAGLAEGTLLRLRFDDVIEDRPPSVAPAAAHIASILEFGRTVTAHPKHRILIHCHMGISRSTAAAIMLLAGHHGDAEGAVARVTELRPVAWPNLRMIELADAQLGLDQRLVRAVRRHHARALQRQPALRETFMRYGRAREVEGLEGLEP